MSARKAQRRPKAQSIGTAPRDVVYERIAALQHRVYQMAGICQVSSTAAGDACHGTGGNDAARERFAEHAWSALELVSSTLMEIAGDLDGDRILRPESAEGQPS